MDNSQNLRREKTAALCVVTKGGDKPSRDMRGFCLKLQLTVQDT